VLAPQDLRGQLFSRIRRALADWDPAPRAAAVFGSAARGDGGPESDIDLLVIRPTDIRDDDLRWADQVDALAQDVRRWSGNAASIIQVTSDEMVAMVGSGQPGAEELRRDMVDLTGVSVFSVLKESGA
jgi:predicted nucleotidyltransferase